MALDTYGVIWNKVLLRCPAASSFLTRDWVQNAFRQVAERRRWSWLLKFGQFIAPAVYNTGKVTVTTNSNIVSGTGTVWDTSMVGRQFRIGQAAPIYTIIQVLDPLTLKLDAVYGAPQPQPLAPYEIYQCFFTPPDDFHALVTVWDPAMNWQLWRHIQQVELNTWDAQRASRGQAYVVAHRDYTQNYTGIVGPAIQAVGSGPSPVATTSAGYTAPASAFFTVQVTFSGGSGTALFSWKKGSGPYVAPQLTDSSPQDLQDGVQVYWPTGVVYNAGDTWVIQATSTPQAGLPRYEIWPHQTAAYVYPFLYEARAIDLSDPNAVLPRYIRGDVLLELALAEAARWPGESADKPNPYFNLNLSQIHLQRAERMIMELERQDDETYEQDVGFQLPLGFPYATPLGDAAWLQQHAI